MEHCGWCGLISFGSLSKGKHTLLITLYWLVGRGWRLEGRKFPQWKVKSTSPSQKRQKQWVVFVFARNCLMKSTFLTSSSCCESDFKQSASSHPGWTWRLIQGFVWCTRPLLMQQLQLLKTTHHGYITYRRLHETQMVNLRDAKHEAMFNILLLFRIAHINLFSRQPSAGRDGWFLSVSHPTMNETIKA